MGAEIEVLIFDLGRKRCGVQSTHVREVLRAVSLSSLPRAPAAIEGILDLRGQIVPVIDIRRQLELEDKSLEHTDHFLVLEADGICLAIRVDRAIDLLKLSLDKELPREPTSLIECVAKTADGLVNVINPDRLVSDSETQSFIRLIVASAATARQP